MQEQSGADAIVVGGGVLGCAVAWRLRQAGLSVALVERGEPGAEASSAAAGILGAQMESHGPGPLLELQLASRAMYPRFAEELREAAGVDVRCRMEGVLAQAFSEVELESLRKKLSWQQARGLRAEWFEPQSLASQSSVLQSSARLRAAGGSEGALAALLFADDGQVDNRQLARALRIAAGRAGVWFVRAEARALVEESGRIRGVQVIEDGEARLLAAPRAIVAAGSWSALLAGARIPEGAVRPVRGQMLAFAAPGPLSSRVLTGGGGYAVPRGGRVLVGATVEEAGFEKAVTPEGEAKLRGVAARLIPSLEGAPILERWSGLRPASRDGLPLLGAPRSAPEGTFVCTGHYRSGILLTPVSAALLLDAVLGRAPAHELSPFLPDRPSLDAAPGAGER